MTDQEVEAYRKRLNELTSKCSDGKPEGKIREELKKLAREVGASTYIFYVDTTYGKGTTALADTSELIRNIHQALQTASMVNMCRTATQGYEIATEASRSATDASRKATIHFWIMTIIACASMVAAWVAAYRN